MVWLPHVPAWSVSPGNDYWQATWALFATQSIYEFAMDGRTLTELHWFSPHIQSLQSVQVQTQVTVVVTSGRLVSLLLPYHLIKSELPPEFTERLLSLCIH